MVTNTATAAAVDPQGRPVTSNPSTAETPVDQSSGLQLTKSAAVTDVNGDGRTDLGDTVVWSFLVQDTGTVTANSVAIADPKAGAVTCPQPTLAPGTSTTCSSAPYAITQADVDAGRITNTATATARTPTGTTITSNSSSTSTPVTSTSALQLTKSAAVNDINGDGRSDLGDSVIWSLVLKNTGTATLTAPAVNDPNAGPVNCPVGSMAPGTSVTCTPSPHVVTQADVDAGVVSNTATGSALTPGGTSVGSNPSSTDTSIAQSSALDLVKSATVTDNNADGRTDLSDTIHWTFTVTNSGTTTLTSVVVSDPKAGAVSCPATTLAPEGSTACTAAPYTVTQADVDAGHVDNTATAVRAKPLRGERAVQPFDRLHADRAAAQPLPRQVGSGLRRQWRLPDRPGRRDQLVVPRREHRHGQPRLDPGDRPDGRCRELSDDNAGSRRHDHVHHGAAHHRSGRCRRRLRGEHRLLDRAQRWRRHDEVERLLDGHSCRAAVLTHDDQVGGRGRRGRRRTH